MILMGVFASNEAIRRFHDLPPNGGYRPLDPFGPSPVWEREYSRHMGALNRSPKGAMILAGFGMLFIAGLPESLLFFLNLIDIIFG
jgi:hypothetical protein